MRKYLTILVTTLFFVLGTCIQPALAHVVVKPGQVGIGSRQIFTMTVPSEKDSTTTTVRLVLPDGLQDVTPEVAPGWKIDTSKQGEITWSGGTIPSGQLQEFKFEAQVPAQATDLDWKAYQSYADGTEISWDQTPQSSNTDDESQTPFSITHVINDIQPAPQVSTRSYPVSTTAISAAALALSVLALVLHFRKR